MIDWNKPLKFKLEEHNFDRKILITFEDMDIRIVCYKQLGIYNILKCNKETGKSLSNEHFLGFTLDIINVPEELIYWGVLYKEVPGELVLATFTYRPDAEIFYESCKEIILKGPFEIKVTL